MRQQSQLFPHFTIQKAFVSPRKQDVLPGTPSLAAVVMATAGLGSGCSLGKGLGEQRG